MIKKIALICAAFISATPSPALASFACQGPVARLGGGNALTVDIGYGMWTICSLEQTLGGITPQACESWYALFTSAKLGGKSMMLYFDPANPNNGGISTCAALGEWTQRVPFFLELTPDATLAGKQSSPPSPR